MSKRDREGKFARRHSVAFVAFTWLSSFASLGLLYLIAKAVVADFAQLRSCNSNNSGLSIHNCGKSGLNLGDIALLGLFILSAVLVVSLFAHAWQMVRRRRA